MMHHHQAAGATSSTITADGGGVGAVGVGGVSSGGSGGGGIDGNGGYAPHHHHHHHHHHAAAAAAAAHAASTPMDLHMPQAFPYYRYRDDALSWTDRKPAVDEVGNPSSVNARILELRKEKSRDAARSRRGKENFEFYELAKMLPLPAAITSQLDKASIIRLTISYLKLRDFSGHGDPPWSRDSPTPNKTLKTGRGRSTSNISIDIFEQHQGTHILQSLDGFALALAADGRFLYISETVSIYLGLSQVEMTGSSVFDYIHHQDHSEMADQLGLGLSQGQNIASPGSGSEESASTGGTNNPDVSSIMSLANNPPFKGLDRAFCVRMKSTLTKRGCHFKSSGYRYTFSHTRKAQPPLLGMVGLAIALPPPSVHEIRLESDMFVTRINFDFRIAHCEPKVSDILDYTAEELTGQNLYTLCHGEDANKLRKSHIDLINKGQVLTHYYRMMNKSGGYTWIQTCATVVCNSKNAEEQNIICVNYVISGREYENLVLDCCQLEDNSLMVKREEATNSNDPENGSPDADRGDGRNSGGPNSNSNNPTAPSSGDVPKSSLDNGSGSSNSGGNGGNGTTTSTSATTTPNNAPTGDLHHNHHPHSQLHPHHLPIVLPQQQQQQPPHALEGSEHVNPSRRASKRKNSSSTSTTTTATTSSDEDSSHHHRISPVSSSCHSQPHQANPTTISDQSNTTPTTSTSNSVAPPLILDQPHHHHQQQQQSQQHHHHHPQDQETGVNVQGGGAATVKDLENAMSKHLPCANGTKTPPPQPPTPTMLNNHLASQHLNHHSSQQQQQQQHLNHQPTDFSTDALLKQQRSTIQWIGAHHHHHHHHPHHVPTHHTQHAQQSGTTLPASALLRQLYANRESVIRANVHGLATPTSTSATSASGNTNSASSGGLRASNATNTPSSYYGGEGGPTPPGSEGSYTSEQFLLATQHQNYNAAAAAAAAYTMDYHTSAMTPPASVSPREKHPQLHAAAAAAAAAVAFESATPTFHHQYPDSPLPLKPQVYSYVEQPQFYHHSSAPTPGFHLYHPGKGTAAAAAAAAATPSNWYSST